MPRPSGTSGTGGPESCLSAMVSGVSDGRLMDSGDGLSDGRRDGGDWGDWIVSAVGRIGEDSGDEGAGVCVSRAGSCARPG